MEARRRTRVMRKRLGAVLGVVVMALASASGAAAARIPAADINYQATGGIDYTWVGVPARNCAAEGVCGVEGSLQVIADGSSGGGSGQGGSSFTDDGYQGRTSTSLTLTLTSPRLVRHPQEVVTFTG